MKEFIDKLIERLEERKNHFGTLVVVGKDDLVLNYNLGKMHSFEDAIEIVNQLAEEHKDDIQTIDVSELLGEQGNDGWIPCSERLPDKSMCTDDSGFVTVETTEVLENGERVTFIEDYSLDAKEFLTPYKVIAWRNRPQPYQPKGQANE